jgi:5-methyltetrahydrofolate--homocysteine methyltransferase
MNADKSISNALLQGKRNQIAAMVRAALEDGRKAEEILEKELITGMAVVGKRMEKGELFIPEVLMAAKCMSKGLDCLKPHLDDYQTYTKGKAVIGTVKGDLHDIGKNLVAMMFEGSGLEVINLGIDVSSEDFLAAAEKHQADLICLSALLTTTMPQMEKTVQAIKANGLKGKVKIMVGGAPVTQEFADEIGADAYSPDAAKAVVAANRLLAQ